MNYYAEKEEHDPKLRSDRCPLCNPQLSEDIDAILKVQPKEAGFMHEVINNAINGPGGTHDIANAAGMAWDAVKSVGHGIGNATQHVVDSISGALPKGANDYIDTHKTELMAGDAAAGAGVAGAGAAYLINKTKPARERAQRQKSNAEFDAQYGPLAMYEHGQKLLNQSKSDEQTKVNNQGNQDWYNED